MQGMSDITCYTCGKQGHMSFDCGKAVDRPWPADAAALDAPFVGSVRAGVLELPPPSTPRAHL